MAARDRLDPPVASSTTFSGSIYDVRVSEYLRPSGLRVRRDVIVHPGAVVVVPVVDDHLLLVRQPREAVERYLLELPAGKLDMPGEPPLECAKRELAEEVGHRAASWEDLGGFFTVPAIMTEFIHCFLATGLEPVAATAIPEEEIEVVRWPVHDIDALLAELVDAKSLVGVHRYARRLHPNDRSGGEC